MLGFDFYGAGNIGDDLTLAGFLEALRTLRPESLPRLYGICPHDVLSQRRRFPEIEWNPPVLPEVACWAGVGDTPFQTTCGDWFLQYLRAALPRASHIPRRVLVAVGAESEIEPQHAAFREIAAEFQRISTRDEHSRRIMIDVLGIRASQVHSGADLANVSLAKLTADSRSNRPIRMGLIIAGDTLSPADLSETTAFLATRNHPVSFIACETRSGPHFERGIHPLLESSLPAGRLPLRCCRYGEDSLPELIRFIPECQTVVGNRYHGLLAAAWAGCKVAAIGRSSKVTALAKDLNVPLAMLPLSRERLARGDVRSPYSATRDVLRSLAKRAIDGVAFCFGTD